MKLRRLHSYSFLIPLLLLTAALVSVTNASPADLETLRTQVESERQSAHVAGLAVAVVLKEQILLSEGFGEADVALHKPVTPDTLFVVASVSKTMVAAAIMKSIEQARVSLDAPVTRYLPFKIDNPLAPSTAPTLRQLAAHTSGISDDGGGTPGFYNGPLNYNAGADNPLNLGDFLKDYLQAGGAYYSDKNFSAIPGAKESYSNIGAALAGFVVGRAVHQPFDQYCRKVLFEPLKMHSTGWHMRDVDMSRHALTYDERDGQWVAFPFYGLATWPDGGLRTSSRDLAAFVGMVMNRGTWQHRQVLKSSSVDEMLARTAVDAHPNEPRRAVFWHYLPAKTGENGFDRNVYVHSGADPGVYTLVMFDPTANIAVVILTNAELNDRVRTLKNKVVQSLFDFAAARSATADTTQSALRGQ